MKTFFLFLIPLSLAFTYPVIAQVEEEVKFVTAKDTVIKIDERRFIHNGKIYRDNSPYLTIGYGVGYNLDQDSVEQNLLISYHHFIKKFGVGAGLHNSRNGRRWEFFPQKVNDVYLSLGYRMEGLKSNVGLFVGPSYAWGGYIKYDNTLEEDRYFTFRNALGMVAELQYTYKFLYDVGIGFTAYASVNKYTQVVGAQLHIFLSTAFVRSYD